MWDFSVRCKNVLTFYMSILLQVPPPPKNWRYAPVIVCPDFPIFFGGGGGGQARGEDLIDMASPVVAVLTFIYMYMPASGWRCLIVD